MKLNPQLFKSVIAPAVMARALKAFDRATMVVVLSCWGAAVVIMAFAIYTLSLSITAKRETLVAAATEPGLPKVVNKPLESAELKPLVDRLQKRFPDIKIDMSRERTISVSASDPGNFRLWLTVLSYIDTMTPQYRWSIKELCVGSGCDRTYPMRAILGADKVTFVTPETGK